MWKQGLGKRSGHGENQKLFVSALTEMMMMMLETPILTLRHITWFISTSAIIISSCPPSFSWLPVFQQGWLICSQPSPPSVCALLFLRWVVLSNTLTLKSAELSTTLGSSNVRFPPLLSTASGLWKPLCSLCFSSSAISPSQMPWFVKHKQISPGQSHVPHHEIQRLLPLLTCLNTQDLTRYVVAKRKLLKWMTLILYTNYISFLLSGFPLLSWKNFLFPLYVK